MSITIWLGGQGWRGAAIVAAAGYLPLASVLLARTAGRLRDRDRSPWWLALYGILYLVSFAPIEDLERIAPIATLAIALGLLAFFIWFFAETWILGGTPGPNRFGPAPGAVATGPPRDPNGDAP